MYITFIPVTFNPDLKPEVVAQDMFWKRYSFLKEISAFITDKYTEGYQNSFSHPLQFWHGF